MKLYIKYQPKIDTDKFYKLLKWKFVNNKNFCGSKND